MKEHEKIYSIVHKIIFWGNFLRILMSAIAIKLHVSLFLLPMDLDWNINDHFNPWENDEKTLLKTKSVELFYFVKVLSIFLNSWNFWVATLIHQFFYFLLREANGWPTLNLNHDDLLLYPSSQCPIKAKQVGVNLCYLQK